MDDTHVQLADAAHAAVALDDVTALDEALVHLRLGEAPRERPHGLHGRLDLLQQDRAALVRLELVLVEPAYEVLLAFQQRLEIGRVPPCLALHRERVSGGPRELQGIRFAPQPINPYSLLYQCNPTSAEAKGQGSVVHQPI